MHRRKVRQLKNLSKQFIGFICLSTLINVQAQQLPKQEIISIDTSYLKSRDELKEYILDTGDELDIEFINHPKLSDSFEIDAQGEIYFQRIKSTYVRGLTITELSQLLEQRYSEFLIDPEVNIRISTFKPIRVAIKGEIRSPGIVKFPAFLKEDVTKNLDSTSEKLTSDNQRSYLS